MPFRFAWIMLWLLPMVQLHSQPRTARYFDRYTTASGLSHNTITGIAQDATGYIWTSTASGLNRFNGHSFVQFHSNSDSLSLPAEETNGLVLLKNRWLVTFTSGLHIIDTKTGVTKNLFIPYRDSAYQFKFNMIMRVLGDGENLYVLTRSGFYHFDCCGKLLYRFDYYPEQDVPVTHFFFGRELFELDDSRLLFIGTGGYYVYDKRTHTSRPMQASDSPVWAALLKQEQTDYHFFQPSIGEFFIIKANSDSITYLNALQNRKVVSRLPFIATQTAIHYRSRLVGISDSVFYLTDHTAGFYKLRFQRNSGKISLDTTKFFRDYQCTALLTDEERNLWIGTTRGLFRQNEQLRRVQVTHLPAGTDQRYPDIKLDDIYLSDSKVYAATRGEAGLLIFDKNTMRLEDHLVFPGESNSIRAILAKDDAHLLFATNEHLLVYNKASKTVRPLIPASLRESWCSDMIKDRRGNIWITATSIHRYEPSTGKFTVIPNLQKLLSIPSSLEEDLSGNIWVAGHGLARYNVAQARYDIVLDSFPYIKMPDKQINFVTADKQNRIWFNANNNGLTSYDIASGKYRHFTRNEGLPDDNIASLFVLGNRLWIACYSGIACMDLNTLRIESFGTSDGFPDMPVSKGARFAYDSTTNQLYIGFATAVARFNPDDVLQRKVEPKTFIETIVVNEKKRYFLPENEIIISWKDNDIRVSIGNISYSNEHTAFAYRIFGDSLSAWIPIGREPSFSISALRPGVHTIQVKAYSPSNRWQEQVRSITIRVLPPLWLKTWFLVLLAITVAGMIYLLIRWRTGLVRKKEMEKTQVEKIKAENYKNQFELEQISSYFSASLAEKKTTEEVLWDVAQNLIGRMGYEDCIIYLWNSNRTRMIQKAAFGPKGRPEFISEQKFDVLPGQGVVGHVINTHQPYLVTDTRLEPLYRVDDAFRLSEVCVPIMHNKELIGVIDSEHTLPGYFSERDIKILTTIATLISNKLQQLQSQQSLDATHRQLQTINEQLAEARLSALQAQMNPHFVFNALNSIKRMILDGDNERASRYLSKFALMIRMTLNHSKELFVSLEENILYLRSYLEMEQLRFDDSFSYQIEIEEGMEDAEIIFPSMMIQPLVENAVWHGLMPSGEDKKLRIGFSRQQNRLVCTVEDNGIGIRESEKRKHDKTGQHQSVGLENLRKRLNILNEKYHLAARLEIIDRQETDQQLQGTRVVLSLNLINM